MVRDGENRYDTLYRLSNIVKAHDEWWKGSVNQKSAAKFYAVVFDNQEAAKLIVSMGLFSDAVQANVQVALDALIAARG